MGLNVSRGNMYSWVSHTWNTIKGSCSHGCSYCYVKRWGNQKPVHLDEKEFKTDLGVNNIIFIGSSCDMFAEDIPTGWIYDTIEYAREFESNTYLYQSKNPERMLRYVGQMGDLARVCTTIETNRWYPDVMGGPAPKMRAEAFSKFKFNRYVTIEPIMDFDLREMVELIKQCNPVQVNIGADSGGHNLPEPDKDKVMELINELQKFTQIDQKRNLNRILSHKDSGREF